MKVKRLGSTDGLLPSVEELKALKRFKDILFTLIDRGEWQFSLSEPPVGNERRASVFNVVREARASGEDCQHWAELRSIWNRLQNVRYLLPPFSALHAVGEAIARGKLNGMQYGRLARCWRSEYDQPENLHSQVCEAIATSQTEPVPIDFTGIENEWIFKDNRYSTEEVVVYGHEEQKLLVLDEFDRERRHFEHLRNKLASGGSRTKERDHPRVPEGVRIEVWRRDGGRCARCGSRENLEYDHIVPLAKGGSNTARNIELLCEVCNRSKGDRIE